MITEFAAVVDENAPGWEIEDAVVKVEPPAKPTPTADVTVPTNRNVTVTATFSDDSAVKQYSFDGETWKAYPDGGIVMENNGTVYFRGIDMGENVSEVASIVVSNIDKIPPEAPAVQADITTPTNQNVTVTATFSDDSATREYSFDGETWKAYTTGVVMKENGSVYFRAADALGNVSDVTEFEVANIDKVAPEAPTAAASTTEPTNTAVTVTAKFSDDSATREYSLDGKTWQAYTAGVVMSQNGKVYFRGADSAGNVSAVTVYEVTNIATVGPKAPKAQADITTPTNQNVTVTATFSADSAVKEYSLDGKTWKAYTTGVVMKENGSVYFRATDAAGNVSAVTGFEVANIDRVAPNAPKATADIKSKTGKSVTVTATFSDDSAVREYSLDNKTWQKYTTGVVMSQNGKVYFRGADAAGNVSNVATYSVTNIDGTLAPVGKVVSGETGKDTPSVTYKAELDAAGLYTVAGKFGTMKGSVTIFDGKKKVASGSIKAGVLTFKKDALLDKKNTYTIEIRNTDKKSSGAAFSWKLTAKELFTKGDNTDDTLTGAKTLAAGKTTNDWVGYGDAVDYYKLGVDANGGFYDLDLSGVRNNVKLTVYSAAGKKIKSVSASAKKPNIALAGLCLAKGSYAVIEAPKAKKAQNSDYNLKLTQNATFTGMKNNDWAQAEVLKAGAAFKGALTKAPGGDVVDYCDVSKIDNLTFGAVNGKTKVSFFDKDHNKVKVAKVTMANGSEKKNVASLTLAAGNATTDHFTIAAIDDAVKYMKIEASGKTLNGYTITKIS